MKQRLIVPEYLCDTVAPRAGAWIETNYAIIEGNSLTPSPPARGRGLKRFLVQEPHPMLSVAPRAGAWIETTMVHGVLDYIMGRPPRGGVD